MLNTPLSPQKSLNHRMKTARGLFKGRSRLRSNYEYSPKGAVPQTAREANEAMLTVSKPLYTGCCDINSVYCSWLALPTPVCGKRRVSKILAPIRAVELVDLMSHAACGSVASLNQWSSSGDPGPSRARPRNGVQQIPSPLLHPASQRPENDGLWLRHGPWKWGLRRV